MFPRISQKSPLILASASPRRKQLLAQSGLPFRSVPSRVDEGDISGDPAQTSCSLAEKKALDVKLAFETAWILGADTMVVIDNELLGKPGDEKEARRMLGLLSGREHRVVTGFCILNPSGEPACSEAVSTLVRIKKITEREIRDYISTGEPYGKAGSYAIQGIGSFMVEAISGSYTNVVGLPLCAVIRSLISVGALKRFPLLRGTALTRPD